MSLVLLYSTENRTQAARVVVGRTCHWAIRLPSEMVLFLELVIRHRFYSNFPVNFGSSSSNSSNILQLTLVLIGELHQRVGQVSSPVEAHNLRLHISRRCLVQLLDPANLERRRWWRLKVDVICKKQSIISNRINTRRSILISSSLSYSYCASWFLILTKSKYCRDVRRTHWLAKTA